MNLMGVGTEREAERGREKGVRGKHLREAKGRNDNMEISVRSGRESQGGERD